MIDIITPTIRHEGIKIVARCLERQTFQDFRWIVVDHDYDLDWFFLNIPVTLWTKTIYLRPKVQIPERPYKLWNTRNTAYQFLERPLVVEIQDYHWFRSDTLQRFKSHFEQVPNALISDYYKIVTFKNYDLAMESDGINDEDLEIIDATGRAEAKGRGLAKSKTPYLAYEMNVSSIPLDILRKYIPVDETMDNGYLVDTHYFSIPAMCQGHNILIDGDAMVYSFEHKLIEARPQGWRSAGETNKRFLADKYKDMLEAYKRGMA
jgi:hypothetical protein